MRAARRGHRGRGVLQTPRQPATSGSAIDVLDQLALEPELPAECASILTHLLQKVNTEFKLPAGVDLIAEARLLRQQLLPD